MARPIPPIATAGEVPPRATRIQAMTAATISAIAAIPKATDTRARIR
jgi:hypothetical protein